MIESAWRKSSYSDSGSECVEVHGHLDAIRDSKNPDGPMLMTSREAVAALIKAIKREQL